MACDFCATGKEGFTRSLLADEMVDQIITVQNDFGHRVTNVVAMGQGEPFLNYDELIKVLRILNDPQGMKIGARHITVSTCGIIDGIRKFAEEPEQFTLAISLHSAIQEKRDDLMPKVANQPLDKLKDALKEYVKKTGRRITLEYVLIKGVNDQTEDLGQLASFCKDLLCHVNLLPMNKVEGLPYKPSPKATAAFWKESLEKRHIETTLRISRGKDIKGACGQLKSTQ